MFELTDQTNYQYDGAGERQHVGCRVAEPHTLYAECQRQQVKGGQQENKLPAERQEHALLNHPQALEKVGADDLEAD